MHVESHLRHAQRVRDGIRDCDREHHGSQCRTARRTPHATEGAGKGIAARFAAPRCADDGGLGISPRAPIPQTAPLGGGDGRRSRACPSDGSLWRGWRRGWDGLHRPGNSRGHVHPDGHRNGRIGIDGLASQHDAHPHRDLTNICVGGNAAEVNRPAAEDVSAKRIGHRNIPRTLPERLVLGVDSRFRGSVFPCR